MFGFNTLDCNVNNLYCYRSCPDFFKKSLKVFLFFLVFLDVFLIHSFSYATLNYEWKKVNGTWSKDSEGTFGTIATYQNISIPNSSDMIIIGCSSLGSGVYRSMDGGESWEEINSGIQKLGLIIDKKYPPITKIVISPSDPNIVYLATANDDPTSTGGRGNIYKSNNKGNTWIKVNGEKNWLGISQIQGAVLDISIDPNNPDILVSGVSAQGIYKTTNGGLSWEEIFSASLQQGAIDHFNVVRINPINSKEIFFSGFTYYSEDIIPNPVCIFQNCNEEPTISGTPGILPTVIHRSTDGGEKWDIVNSPISGELNLITDLDINNKTGDIYISTATYSTPFFYAHDNKGVFKSSDNGKSWISISKTQSGSLSQFPVYSIAIDQRVSDRLFVSTGHYGIFSSSDGGLNWELVTGLPDNTFIGNIEILKDKLFALTSNGIFISNIDTCEIPISVLPDAVTVNIPSNTTWKDSPPPIEVKCPNAERIYCKYEITTDGSKEPTGEPTESDNNIFDQQSTPYITGDSGQFQVWAKSGEIKYVKVKFRGKNSNGYGPTSQVYTYVIDRRETQKLLPDAISVTPSNTNMSWKDSPPPIEVKCPNADFIYCKYEITTDGKKEPAGDPTESDNNMFDKNTKFITGNSGQFKIWADPGQIKYIKVRFRGKNSNGYGPTSQVYTYVIDRREKTKAVLPGAISVNPQPTTWESLPQHDVDVSSSYADKIYCAFTFNEGEEPPDPTVEHHPFNERLDKEINGASGKFTIWADADGYKVIKVRFVGWNANGYGPISKAYTYRIDLSKPSATKKPDFVVRYVVLGEEGRTTFSPGEKTKIYTKVKNIGGADPTRDVHIQYFRSNGEKIDKDKDMVQIGEKDDIIDNKELSKGKSGGGERFFDIPPTPGIYNITVIVDP